MKNELFSNHTLTEKELIPDVSAEAQTFREDVLIISIKGMHEERLGYEFQANMVGDGMERLRNLVKIKKLDRVISDMYQLLL